MYKSITNELLSINLHHEKSFSIIIAAFYRPPNCVSAESVKCVVVDELHDIRINHPNCEFRVSGDLNLPDIDWSNKKKYYQYPMSMSLEFPKIPFYYDPDQMVNMPS